MKKIVLVFASLIFVISNPAFAKDPCNNPSPDTIAAHFLNAFIQDDYAAFQSLLPTGKVVKKYFGDEGNADEKTLDQQIKDNPKNKNDWEKLHADASEKGIDLSTLKLDHIGIEKPYGEDHPLKGLEITLTSGLQTYNIALALVQGGDCWYISEILKSTGVWD